MKSYTVGSPNFYRFKKYRKINEKQRQPYRSPFIVINAIILAIFVFLFIKISV
jgi:hypothetical protein